MITLWNLPQRCPLVGAKRPGEARFDIRQIDFDGFGKNRLFRFAPQPLLFRIGFDEFDLVWIAARRPEKLQCSIVDREETHRGAVLRRHIRQSRSIRQRQVIQSGSKILNKFPDNAVGAEPFRDRQDRIRCRRAFRQASNDTYTHHIRD